MMNKEISRRKILSGAIAAVQGLHRFWQEILVHRRSMYRFPINSNRPKNRLWIPIMRVY